jgi:hypothetical protein
MIKVEYEVHSTMWHIKKCLQELQNVPMLSFDTETRGVYTPVERYEAKEYLKKENIPVNEKTLALQVANNSGLSFPTLVNVTHFVFGLTDHSSIVIICDRPQLEKIIWNWIAQYPGKMLVHNTLYDLKIMYSRVGKLPKDYEDTALLAKCMTNNSATWKAKVGLKDLMASYYDPKWALMDDYEPINLKDPGFLMYAAIDGAATVKLWNDIQEYLRGQEE